MADQKLNKREIARLREIDSTSDRYLKSRVWSPKTTDIGSDHQSEQERESDFIPCAFGLSDCRAAAFFDGNGMGLCERCYRSEIAAGDNPTIPDAGAEDVERVARAIYLQMFPERDAADWQAEAGREDGRLRAAYLECARAALAVMPRRGERAGMLRAAEIAYEEWSKACNSEGTSMSFVYDRLRAEAEALRTSTPEQPRDDGWQPIRELVMLIAEEHGGLPGSVCADDDDDEATSHSMRDGKMVPGKITFGHIRRAVAALPPAPVTK